MFVKTINTDLRKRQELTIQIDGGLKTVIQGHLRRFNLATIYHLITKNS